ncbi:hypothetical protein VC83_05587 [Pseudogymnoascus destructans]|uniref:Uncharacterized protein n=1 Tax=Pseudogymnoascus destructans TaxID=655981 RepID=A0A177A8H9_9PEZI|nr:uncharacterized protein VC83_05587 [Pseudogymnoascus destructans]OAF57732.1 hypothetical protein VC83_05587 [Pseudogymnoascus destructans]
MRRSSYAYRKQNGWMHNVGRGQTGYMARPATPPKLRTRPPKPTTTTNTTMVKRRSIKAQERDFRLCEAILGIQTGKYKSANAAAVALGLRPDTVRRRVSGVQHNLHKQKRNYPISSYQKTKKLSS